VPETVAAHCEVCDVLMDEGDAVTEIEVMMNGTVVTPMEAEPEIFVNPACVDVALHVPVPAPDGVNTPPCEMVPPVAVHVTPELNAPVPLTVATQVEVCEVVMAEGLATTRMLVTVGGAFVMLIEAEPDTLVNPDCVDVALQVPVPVPDGVKTPPCVIVPPVAVHVTPEPYAPVPLTLATQVAVCEELIVEGFAVTEMPVTVTGTAVDVTVMDAVPVFEESCVEVAVQVPVPVPDGVNTPACVMVPPVAAQETEVL
jgi:hypothetical protein